MKIELKNIGAWGRMHYDFLYRSNRTVINVMRLNGTLNGHLADIDCAARDMFDSSVRRTSENKGVTEQFKISNRMKESV